MRRTPLQRKTALRRKPPDTKARFTFGPANERKRPLAFRSAKRAREQRTRAQTVRSLVEAGQRCEIGPVLHAAGIDVQCQGEITGLHERRKRSSAGSLTNPANTIPACSICNLFAEDEPGLVRRLTGDRLVVRPGDPEWEALGRNTDRTAMQHVKKRSA